MLNKRLILVVFMLMQTVIGSGERRRSPRIAARNFLLKAVTESRKI
jgi:hypothetical protein